MIATYVPPFSHAAVKAILDIVMTPDRVQLMNTKDRLIKENHAAGGRYAGFLFGGKFIRREGVKPNPKDLKSPLAMVLWPQGREYLENLKRFEADEARMKAGLSLILRSCQGWQDIRDTLPDTLAELLPPEVSSLPRTREELYTLEGNELHLNQCQSTLNLLASYKAARFLY